SVGAALESLVDDPVEVRTRTQGPPPFAPGPPDDDDDGDRHGDDDDHHGTSLSNARLGMLIFLGAETMFFAGLLGAFLVYRIANETWPSMSMPRLPVEVTGINTLILLYSASTMWRANRAIRLGQQQELRRLLLYTAVLGVVFLTVQGYEWAKLIGYGLTLSSGVYGATFYTLIGCRGLQVWGAVGGLCTVGLRPPPQLYRQAGGGGLFLWAIFGSFVVVLGQFLSGLVYLY